MARVSKRAEKVATKDAALTDRSKRTYLKQSDVPSASLSEALRIPDAIFEHYAGKPTSPFQVAKALNVDPNGTQLKVLSGASIAFGLVEGGAQAASISVTDLSIRIVRPKTEHDNLDARREAVLKPRVFGEFLRKYDGHVFPRSDLALNILEEMGVPRDKTNEVLERIESSAQSVGFLETIKGKIYVSIRGSGEQETTPIVLISEDEQKSVLIARPDSISDIPKEDINANLAVAAASDLRKKRVFVTHGKNRSIVEPIKRLLEYGELLPVVSVERESVSKPVPEKFYG